jgi:hypothetical protein
MVLSPTATWAAVRDFGQSGSAFSYFGGEAYAEACRRASEASSGLASAGLEHGRGDDRSLVGQALIGARRLIRLNRRTLIRGHGAAQCA